MSDSESEAKTMHVEVAYAEPQRQFLRRIALPNGATVADAIAASDIAAEFDLEVNELAAGIWYRVVARDAVLRDGDRVELYRPLQIDPKESRRRRAASVAFRS